MSTNPRRLGEVGEVGEVAVVSTGIAELVFGKLAAENTGTAAKANNKVLANGANGGLDRRGIALPT